MTDNAKAYRQSRIFQATLKELCCHQLLTPPYHPQLNGKVEHFHRTLLEECAYLRPYLSNEVGCACWAPGCAAKTTTEPTPLSAASLP